MIQQVAEMFFGGREDAKGSIRMGDRRYDRQQAQRGVKPGFLKSEPAQCSAEEVWPEAEFLAYPGRIRAKLVAAVKPARQPVEEYESAYGCAEGQQQPGRRKFS